MTIDDAIAILEQEYELAKVYNEHLGKPAIKLGIEALKAIQETKWLGILHKDYLLPGETKD